MTFIFGTSFWILPQAYLQALEYLKDNVVVSAVAMTDGDKKESVALGQFSSAMKGVGNQSKPGPPSFSNSFGVLSKDNDGGAEKRGRRTAAALVQEARVTRRIPRQRRTSSLHRSASRAGGKKRGRNWHGCRPR